MPAATSRICIENITEFRGLGDTQRQPPGTTTGRCDLRHEYIPILYALGEESTNSVVK